MHAENNIIGIPQKYHGTDEYPENWKEIAQNIKKLAGWRCEKCGHINDYRTGHVLTVHHINGLKHDVRPRNLVALCQRCHLVEQAKLRLRQRFTLVELQGQKSMFPHLSEKRKLEALGQQEI